MNRLTSIFKLLSDETRLRMLVLLYQEELCVCQLSGILDAPQPRVSQNLAKFRDLDLVTDVRSEKYVYYSLKRDNKTLMRILDDITSEMDSQPRLLLDRKGLAGKEIYLAQCGDKCGI
jgi:ArsR family transcriptional regulator